MPKRRQVKNACIHCQKACKKCDDCRPCLRCTKYNITEQCVNSPRKRRESGCKRGPYKKRNEKSTLCSSLKDLPPLTRNLVWWEDQSRSVTVMNAVTTDPPPTFFAATYQGVPIVGENAHVPLQGHVLWPFDPSTNSVHEQLELAMYCPNLAYMNQMSC